MDSAFYLILAGFTACGYVLYRYLNIIKVLDQVDKPVVVSPSSDGPVDELSCIDCGDRTITALGDCTIVTTRKPGA